jgi:prevent-host-death family protein
MATIGNRRTRKPGQPVAPAARWQLQAARARFSRLIDEALAGRPQRITRRGKDVAVVVAATDFDRLTKPREGIVDFFRNSPLAEAMAGRDLDLERERDPIRELDW